MPQYRREIDGLRAVAVIPVIFFHAGFESFSGGFIGVDVFFVISGFLITTIITSDIDAGKFNVLKFYERRARRILPALFVVTLLCIPPALLWMSPEELEDFGQSVIAVSLFSSNFLFWLEADYFLPVAEMKPLLHTWSLAVEEQFYLLFPLFMLLMWNRWRSGAIALLSCVIIASFLFAEWASVHNPEAGFYLLPTRGWELLIGALCAVFVTNFGPGRNELLSAAGAFLIVGSFCFMDSATPFPGAYALAPVSGTALILVWGSSETVVGKLLGLPLFVGIGLVSYSAYLFHQPLFAYLRIVEADGTAEYFVLAILTFVLAAVSWKYIETPARRYKTRRCNIIGAAITSTLIISLLGAGTFYFTPAMPADYRGEALARAAIPIGCDFYTQRQIDTKCISASDQIPNILLWGDSHAWALSPGIREAVEGRFNVLQITTSACKPEFSNIAPKDVADYPVSSTTKTFDEACKKSNATASSLISAGRVSDVLVAMAGNHTKALNTEFVRFVSQHITGKIVFIGPAPQWRGALPRFADSQVLVEKNLKVILFQEDALLINKFKDNSRINCVSLLDYLCDRKNLSCLVKIPGAPKEDRYLTWDYGHLSLSGSRYVSKHLLTRIIGSE